MKLIPFAVSRQTLWAVGERRGKSLTEDLSGTSALSRGKELNSVDVADLEWPQRLKRIFARSCPCQNNNDKNLLTQEMSNPEIICTFQSHFEQQKGEGSSRSCT